MNQNLEDLTDDFSVNKWNFSKGSIIENEDKIYTLILPISKFILDTEIIETSIRLDFVELTEPLISYIGKTIIFPINPEEGYIDGSVYLRNAHNPVDVTEIRFATLKEGNLTIEISMQFIFDYEGIGFKNEDLKKELILAVS